MPDSRPIKSGRISQLIRTSKLQVTSTFVRRPPGRIPPAPAHVACGELKARQSGMRGQQGQYDAAMQLSITPIPLSGRSCTLTPRMQQPCVLPKVGFTLPRCAAAPVAVLRQTGAAESNPLQAGCAYSIRRVGGAAFARLVAGRPNHARDRPGKVRVI